MKQEKNKNPNRPRGSGYFYSLQLGRLPGQNLGVLNPVEANKISVFLPFYNEKDILRENVKRVEQKLKELNKDYEIFLIDDNSKDSSSEIAKELAKDKKIKYIFFNNGPSRRENLAQAFRKATNPLILFMDIDLATDLNHLNQLISEIEHGADISTGSRYSGIKAKREFSRKMYSFFYNLFIRIYFNSKILDHQCGFKAFKKEIVLKLIDEIGYDNSFTRGWFWDAELLIRAQKKGYKISVIPVKWIFAKKSSFNFRRELKVIPYMIKLKMRLI